MSHHLIHNSDCALLVLSCDAYSDLWPPFFTLLRRHWPDCPLPVYLGTGAFDCAEPDVTILHSNGGRDWGKCTLDYLQQLPHSYVLLMLDDFFLRQPVSTSSVLHCLDFARRNSSIQLRLIPRPQPTDRLAGEKLIGESAYRSPYRLSAQAAIWDRTALCELLRPGESIWAFEAQGNLRALSLKTGFFSTWTPVLPYEGRLSHHVIEKGKWLPSEKLIFGRQNIGCDFSQRGTLPLRQTLFYHLAQVFDRSLNRLPWRAKAWVKQRMKALLRPFLRRPLERLAQPISK